MLLAVAPSVSSPALLSLPDGGPRRILVCNLALLATIHAAVAPSSSFSFIFFRYRDEHSLCNSLRARGSLPERIPLSSSGWYTTTATLAKDNGDGMAMKTQVWLVAAAQRVSDVIAGYNLADNIRAHQHESTAERQTQKLHATYNPTSSGNSDSDGGSRGILPSPTVPAGVQTRR